VPPKICIDFAPTQEEVASYQSLLAQRHTGDREAWEGDMIVMVVLAVVSVGVGLLCVTFGLVVDTKAGGIVCLLCCVTYYVTHAVRDWLVRRYHERAQVAWYARAIARNYRVEMDQAGVTERTSHRALTFGWPGIDQVVVHRDMLFLWTSDSRAIVVPLRAVAEAERDAVVAFAQKRGASPPGPLPAEA
jgi:hypothetical protein